MDHYYLFQMEAWKYCSFLFCFILKKIFFLPFISTSDEYFYISTGYLDFSGPTLSPLTFVPCGSPTLCWEYTLIFLLLWPLPALTNSSSSSQGPHPCDLLWVACLCSGLHGVCAGYLHLMSCVCVHACIFSYVWLFMTPWTVACQVPPSMEFSRQEYWRGLAFLPPGDLCDPGIKTLSLVSPALAGGFFTTVPSAVLVSHSFGVCYSLPPKFMSSWRWWWAVPFCHQWKAWHRTCG